MINYEELYRQQITRFKLTQGGTQAVGLCPFHNEKKPSFSVNLDTGLYFCHSCSKKGNAYQFAEAMNHPNPAEWIDENNKQPPHPKNVRKPPQIDLWKKTKSYQKNLSIDWIKKSKTAMEMLAGKDEQGRLTFPYFNKNGEVVGIKHHKGKNDESPYWEGDGSGKWCGMQLLEGFDRNKPLCLCEGEKDCLRMLSLEHQATTGSAGAGSIPKDLSPVAGFIEYIIIFDNDKAGNEGAAKLAERMAIEFGKLVKIAQWREGLQEGYDVSDDAENGFEEMDYAIVNAKEYKPPRKGFRTMSVTELTDNITNKPKPIIRNLLYEKGVTVIAGTDGVGKTWLATQAALSIATGIPFLEWETSQKPVLLVQFELSPELLSSRLRKQMKSFPTVPNGYPKVVYIDIEEKLFTSQWEKIKDTITENNLFNGVVIVDNLYTSVTGDVSDNTQMMKILSDVAHIRNSTGNAIILVAHHNKGTLIDKKLHKDQIQGGKQLTNFVSNVLQIGESKISTELRVAKITKIRDEQSELENIPFKLHWDNDSVTFSRGSIIPKEEVHFIEPKERWEIKVLLELAAFEDFLKNPQFNRERLRPFLPEDINKRTETRLLNRWIEWGFVKYVKYNTYEFNFNSIKDLQS